ncbi:PD-(D/E)XK nuclease family protein [Kineosporia sp. NBRC 101731]|uniref:PD-(D/E)XK nuclease family protein n=1 Tax=Kineosporia sp. NBRC 101731 TaxID=3032199 RepID=UPI002556B20B|nr:PD-(D/E)XK nuclease family protein [Kineosporia sp. NBRC 101731]
MEVLDKIEFKHQSVEVALAEVFERKSLHEGVHVFVASAVQKYLDATGSSEQLLPVHDQWVVQHRDAGVRELWTWGRRYRSRDGGTREVRLLRQGRGGTRQRSDGERAVAAYTTAVGSPAPQLRFGQWQQKFAVREAENVSQVKVVEVDLVEGTQHVWFTGSVDDATTTYDHAGRSAAGRLAYGHHREPGKCFDCRLLTSCDEVVRAPGLLGIRSQERLRQVSISDLRYYAKCPAQYFLSSAAHLPRFNEYSMAARLGQAVHEYLENRHREENGPCLAADMPTTPGWSDARWDLDSRADETGRRMLSHHPEVCPLRREISDLTLEKTFMLHDTVAQVLVAAKCDLVYQDDGSWVWRETKTTSREQASDDVIAEYPQVALAVGILGRGLLGGFVEGSRVELEILRPTHSDLIPIDPADTETFAQAEAVIRDLASPWRSDSSFAPTPSQDCRTCPVSKWCPSAEVPDPPSLSEETTPSAYRKPST